MNKKISMLPPTNDDDLQMLAINNAILVTNISPKLSFKEIHDYFSFAKPIEEMIMYSSQKHILRNEALIAFVDGSDVESIEWSSSPVGLCIELCNVNLHEYLLNLDESTIIRHTIPPTENLAHKLTPTGFSSEGKSDLNESGPITTDSEAYRSVVSPDPSPSLSGDTAIDQHLSLSSIDLHGMLSEWKLKVDNASVGGDDEVESHFNSYINCETPDLITFSEDKTVQNLDIYANRIASGIRTIGSLSGYIYIDYRQMGHKLSNCFIKFENWSLAQARRNYAIRSAQAQDFTSSGNSGAIVFGFKSGGFENQIRKIYS